MYRAVLRIKHEPERLTVLHALATCLSAHQERHIFVPDLLRPLPLPEPTWLSNVRTSLNRLLRIQCQSYAGASNVLLWWPPVR
jgi:hypothetical protein